MVLQAAMLKEPRPQYSNNKNLNLYSYLPILSMTHADDNIKLKEACLKKDREIFLNQFLFSVLIQIIPGKPIITPYLIYTI